ncbi:hypothetical protein F66182_1198 [Fusarium sp. NRRL 66182]|nr:hypothetical protein F66182_1198 [Fusarium sp. NRRL 66182]
MSKSHAFLTLMARVLPLAFSIFVLSFLVVERFSTSHDPYRCKALLGNGERDGSWLHAPDETGARKPFTNWQPDGCMLHHYTADDIKQCMGNRHMVFSGDSTTRQVFWGMARLLDRSKADQRRKEAEIHEAYNLTLNGVQMLQIWNPWFETDGIHDFAQQLEYFSQEKHGRGSEKKRSPGLVLLGAGSWFALSLHENESAKRFGRALDNITGILHLDDLPAFGTVPMDPEEGVGNELFIAPVAPPFYEQLPASRTQPSGIQRGEVEAINDYIYKQEKKHNLRIVRAFPALSFNQPGAIVDKTQTGFHVIDSVAEIKANILLNLRCNAKLDRKSGYPYSRTCCSEYGSPSWTHLVVLAFTFLYAALCVCVDYINLVWPNKVSRSPWLNMKTGMFASALLYCYLADRTHFFAKGMKEFVPKEFGILIGICAAGALMTIRKNKPTTTRISGPADAPTKTLLVEDAGALSRDQTEEWKGWMQAVILIYHWTGASRSIPMYIFIRVLVSAYLFQTGYGHTIYFLSNKDFSFRRLACVLLRLNLLSCALPYIMGTDYMHYYFAPLVSFWFLVVYATMAVCSGLNDRTRFLVPKILASFVFVSAVLNNTPALKWTFSLLNTVFIIRWDLDQWTFRVTLDSAIVFVGMLAGLVHQRSDRIRCHCNIYMNGLGPLVLSIVSYACLCIFIEEKSVYAMIHPYISIMPVLAFVSLRNMTIPCRNHFSAAAAWLGRCSLETFILQFHIFLAGDTRGVLLIDGFKGDGGLLTDRWRSLAIIVPIFLWVSHKVSEASRDIVELLMSYPETKPVGGEEDASQLRIIEPVWETLFSIDSHYMGRSRQLLSVSATNHQLRIAAILAVMWLLNMLY